MPNIVQMPRGTKWALAESDNFACRTCAHFETTIQSKLEGREIYPCSECITIDCDKDGNASSTKTLSGVSICKGE